MSSSARLLFFAAIGLTMAATSGCYMVPQSAMRQSQMRAMQLHQQNMALLAERDQASMSAQQLAAEKARLEQGLASANNRLTNLQDERSKLHQRYISLLNSGKGTPSPLSESTTRRFQELAKKYPEFDFDPQTGVSKFHSDILFNSGSADIKSTAKQLLSEFAAIMNDGEANKLNILVVGHTDDKQIVKATTKAQHPTNWHLSTNRADSVVLALKDCGIGEKRMGAAGYSMYQPVVANKDEASREQNRRVEIFVLAPDAIVAGWDPVNSRN